MSIHGVHDGLDLTVHYQPIVDLVSGEVAGAEAIVRPATPARRDSSAVVVRNLRDDGFPVLDFVIERIATDHAMLHRLHPGLLCSVDVERGDLERHDVEAVFERAFRRSRPARFIVEISDLGVLASDRARAGLAALRGLGIEVAVDGFTPTSDSIAMVDELEPEMIKLDPSIVRAVERGDRGVDMGVLAATLATLPDRTDVVAEGVERIGHIRSLRDLGCTKAQGFLFSRALPPEELLATMTTSSRIDR